MSINKKNIKEIIRERRVYFDGGTGTVLQKRGLVSGKAPESWNLEKPEEIVALHKAYLSAGADIIKTNTFGVNSLKYKNYEEYIAAALECAKEAVKEFPEAYIAFDIGPLGKLLKPWGDLDFNTAVETFKNNMRLAEKYGADLILIETMNDAYETKAALLAAKEASALPVFVTNVYDEGCRLMTGADPAVMVALLEAMGADAIGMNCSQGPDKMLPVVKKFEKLCSIPVIVNPNAGLPVVKDGVTQYSFTADEFSSHGTEIAKSGGAVLGGCCGTNPDYIRLLKEKTADIPLPEFGVKVGTYACTYSKALEITEGTLLGEKLDGSKNSEFLSAAEEGDTDFAVEAALDMADEDAEVITLAVDGDFMSECVFEIQSVSNIQMLLKSEDAKALTGAMRIYNGKALVYVSENSADEILPEIKKYGGVAVCENTEAIKKAEAYGIKAKDIVAAEIFKSI